MSKNFITRLKETFHKFNIDPSQVGVQLEDEIKLSSEGKLQDGTMIYSTADTWGVGADIYTMDENGTPVPVAAGAYILEDGTNVMVDENGFISQFGEPVEQEMSSEDLMKIIESLSEKVNALTIEKTELASQLATESEKAIKSSQEASSLKTELSSLKKTASASSVKDTKTHVFAKEKSQSPEKSWSQMTLKERILFNIEQSKSN
jgi:arsenate reductase-like glutaredoxin family protein